MIEDYCDDHVSYYVIIDDYAGIIIDSKKVILMIMIMIMIMTIMFLFRIYQDHSDYEKYVIIMNCTLLVLSDVAALQLLLNYAAGKQRS